MTNPYESRLIRVIEYIHDHLDGDLSLDTLADVAALSRFHFHRVWTGMTGETLAQTTRRIRLYRAAVLLVHEPVDLATVAARSGYRDQSSFTRAFRQAFGDTPAAYRARGRAVPPLWANRMETDPMHDVTMRTCEPRRVAGILHKGDYQRISQAFEKATATVAARNVFEQTRGMVGVYYDDARSRPVADLTSLAGFVVGEDFAITAPFQPVMLVGGLYAVLTFAGPYTGLQAAYDYFFGPWLAQSGETPRDAPCIEVYLNTPMDTAPEALLTEIQMPIAG